MQPVELSTLSRYELGRLLNEIDTQHAAFTQVAIDAERALGAAESALILDPSDTPTKALSKQLRRNLNAVKLQLSSLNKRQSRIQSWLRSMGPEPG